MVIETRRSPPPREPQEKLKDPFPAKLCVLSFLVMAGFYYYLFTLAPPRPGADAEAASRAVSTVGQWARAQPAIFAGAFFGLLVPPLAFRRGAKTYFLNLTLAMAVLWGAAFMISSKPAERAGEMMNALLNQDRHFPETIHSR